MAIKTKRIKTNEQWAKVSEIMDFSMTNDTLYSLQIIGNAKICYSDTTPSTDYFTINFTNPFTYEKKSGEDLYINADDCILTIAG